MITVTADTGPDTYTTIVKARHHLFTADEPQNLGGDDKGPNPMELLAASLAACTNITLQMYAKRKKWAIEAIHIEVTFETDRNTDTTTFNRNIVLRAELDQEQQQKMLEMAEACPIHKVLHNKAVINTVVSI